MKPLIVIPAREGSKGILLKNIKQLNGKPLIHYTIEAVRKIFSDDIICVSTDSTIIKEYVETAGLKVPFLRPKELATDKAGIYEVMLHVLSFYESKGYKPDILIMLQPTSPFRNSKHIQEAIQVFNENIDAEMCVSVKETSSNPYYLLYEENKEGWLQKSKSGLFERRQDVPQVWELNGAIYIIKTSTLKSKPFPHFERIIIFEIDEESSHDIDTELDWLVAEAICNKQHKGTLNQKDL